jgi:hypothetical protein
MKTEITVSTHGFQEGDWLSVPIEIFGVEHYSEYNGNFVITGFNANTLTIERPGWFQSLLFRHWYPLTRAWSQLDWMPDIYYEQKDLELWCKEKQKEWDEWEREALEVLK